MSLVRDTKHKGVGRAVMAPISHPAAHAARFLYDYVALLLFIALTIIYFVESLIHFS